MPKVKEKKSHDVFHFRVYTRPNLGAKAASTKRVPDIVYVGTKSSVKYAQEWIQEHGDKANVYLIEKWNAKNNTRLSTKMPRICYCERCGLFSPEQKRTFLEKWAWNTSKGWHPTGYTLTTEIASIKCENAGASSSS